jgi:pantoate--beta-alanine ligase
MASTPPIIRTIAELRQASRRWRADGLRSAIVPTMGGLHAGHLALVAAGRERADRVVVSIFVNPKQFGPKEDLSRYPRNEQADIEALAGSGAHLVFAPAVDEMYPKNFTTSVTVGGPADAGLEDKIRPHFFAGVATVVARLLGAAETDFAMFGEKDYQQLLVVTRLARDLGLAVEIAPVPTIREADGLAMSSRNAYLSARQRQTAALLFNCLDATAQAIRAGTTTAKATAAARRRLTAGGFAIDYVAVRDADTLAASTSSSARLRLLAAARLGKVRLIDNVPV